RRLGLPNYMLVRYADDWTLMVAGARDDALALREEAAQVLARIGLHLSEEKTLIVGAHLIPQGLCSSNSPGLGRVLILVTARCPGGDDTPGTLVRAVAGSVHEDLVAGVYEPVEQ